jgi:hypothetical protein
VSPTLPPNSLMGVQPKISLVARPLSRVARKHHEELKTKTPFGNCWFPLLCWNFLNVIRPNGTLFHLLAQSGWGKRISEHQENSKLKSYHLPTKFYFLFFGVSCIKSFLHVILWMKYSIWMSSYLSDSAIIKLFVNCHSFEKFIARSDFFKTKSTYQVRKDLYS